MPKFALVLLFVAMTFCSWGIYGPTLHEGQHDLGAPLQPSSLRAFICVGIAYFVIAVVVPVVLLKMKGEKGGWTINGFLWSFAAGAAGALGALGIILAFKSRGNPVYVMPLVFGLAPVVNTFVTMVMARTFREARAIFYVGVTIVAIGAAGVLYFKPTVKNVEIDRGPNKGEFALVQTEVREGSKVTTRWPDQGYLTKPEQLREISEIAYKLYLKSEPLKANQILMIVLAVGMAALCWGSYGPLLHKGQGKMKGSRLRPFFCVGLAYFAIAVVVPMLMLGAASEAGQWNFGGIFWSLLAGTAGAVGALGVIMAFNFGGRPIFVMPLVFGGAPVVNTFTTVLSEGTIGELTSPFFISLALVIAGAVTVLVFTPRPSAKPAAKEVEAETSESIGVEDDWKKRESESPPDADDLPDETAASAERRP